MDGGTVAGRTRAGLRRCGALLALAAAVAPVALLSTGAKAAGPPASSRYATGSAGMAIAQGIAQRHWGVAACAGAVELAWGSDEPSVNARSYWANPRSAYDHPDLNVQCRIVFNAGLAFSWEKFCTVFVHEYGHLVGKPHVGDGEDVMSPIYRASLPACAGTPDPSEASSPTPVADPAEVVDAPVARPRGRRSNARVARTRSHARARAAGADGLRTWSGAAGHEHH